MKSLITDWKGLICWPFRHTTAFYTMVHLIRTQLSCFSTRRLSNCLCKPQDTFAYSNYPIYMLNHSNRVYSLALHPSFAHTCLPKSAQIKTTDYICVESISNALVLKLAQSAWGNTSQCGLVYINKTCDATSLGELSWGSQSNNFLSISVLLTGLEICARGGRPNRSFNRSLLCTAQSPTGNWDPSLSEQVVVRRAAQLKSRQKHAILLPLLLKKRASLVMGLGITETKAHTFLQQFLFTLENIFMTSFGVAYMSCESEQCWT